MLGASVKANLHVVINRANLAQFDKENERADENRSDFNIEICGITAVYFNRVNFLPVLHQQKKRSADKL